MRSRGPDDLVTGDRQLVAGLELHRPAADERADADLGALQVLHDRDRAGHTRPRPRGWRCSGRACSRRVPCEKFRRATSSPARTRFESRVRQSPGPAWRRSCARRTVARQRLRSGVNCPTRLNILLGELVQWQLGRFAHLLRERPRGAPIRHAACRRARRRRRCDSVTCQPRAPARACAGRPSAARRAPRARRPAAPGSVAPRPSSTTTSPPSVRRASAPATRVPGARFPSQSNRPTVLLSRLETEDGPIPDVGGIPINIDPTLFRWDGVPLQITWHGFFTAVGTLVGIWLAVRWATRAGFTEDDTFSVAMWGVIGAIVGARLFHVIDQWDFYAKDSDRDSRSQRGRPGDLRHDRRRARSPARSTPGARSLNVARLADIAAPPLILGMAIGRIGDIINGEHHGAHAAGFPLAVVYTNPNTLGEIGVPVHLAVGYELVMDVVIFALAGLARARPRSRRRLAAGSSTGSRATRATACCSGRTSASIRSAASSSSSIARIPPFALGLSQAQLLSVLTAMVAVWMLVFQCNRARKLGPIAIVTTSHAPPMAKPVPSQLTQLPPDRQGAARSARCWSPPPTKPRSSCSTRSTPTWPATTRTASSRSRPISTASRSATSCPAPPWTIVQESPTTTVIDGHWGFGYTVTERAMQLTIDKADRANVPATTVFRQGHIGRLASYTLMAGRGEHDRPDHRRFGPLGQASRAVRRPRSAHRHQPAVDRHSVRPGRAAVPGHGDLGRRGGQDLAGRLARRVDPAGLDRRSATANRRPTRTHCAKAARCCRSAAARATKAAAWRRSSRSCAAC